MRFVIIAPILIKYKYTIGLSNFYGQIWLGEAYIDNTGQDIEYRTDKEYYYYIVLKVG